MKKHFLKAFLLTYIFALTGCFTSASKAKLTFGNYISDDPFEITYSQAITKMEAKESMLVATYYASLGSCGCQTTFYEVLKEFIHETNYNVYLFNSQEINESKDKYGFINVGYSSPILYIINKGKITNTFSYTQKANEKIFVNKDELTKKVDKYFTKPNYYYVDDEYLNENLSSKDKVGLCIIRNSCSDCKYLIPNFMIPFVQKHDFQTEVWVFDIDSYYETPQYKAIKDKYQLSEEANNILGYSQGVVPTTQYYENGKLISANVYLNDKVELDNESGKYKVSQTYYTSERVKVLPYLDDNYVLENKIIENEEVVSGYWLPTYSSIIHNEIIEKFYTKYFL